jgi:hypothetical protein
MAEEPGFEPGKPGPEPGVMPFHHSSTEKSGYLKHFPSVKDESRRILEEKKAFLRERLPAPFRWESLKKPDRFPAGWLFDSPGAAVLLVYA